MRAFLLLLVLFVLGLPLFPLRAMTPAQTTLRNHMLIVYNNVLPESSSLAYYYAEQRGIPRSRVFGIRCPLSEEVTRAEFNELIQKPIRDHLLHKKWMTLEKAKSPFGEGDVDIMAARTNDVWCIVLMRGVPLKIAHDPTVKEPLSKNAALNTNAASVDSELSVLPLIGLPITGVLPNPYQLLGYNRNFDSLDARQMIMVARLDGPTADDVRRMINDAIYAEQHRLVGRAKIDARGIGDESSGYYQGDRWLLDSAQELIKDGWEVEIDRNPELFPTNLPWKDVAIYAGWYQQDASGPFMRDKESGTFARGAIAYHIHSFSAATLRSTTSNWCGPLIAHGVAATLGSVYEPYLDFMPRWDVFLHRLLQGGTFVESAYASQKVLSWMTVFVGDPLYTPFAISLDDAMAKAPKPSTQYDFLRLQDIREDFAAGKLERTRNQLTHLVNDRELTNIGWEGYADILSDPQLMPPNATVSEAYERAFNLSIDLMDQIRTDLKAARAYEQRFRDQDAKRLLRIMLNRYPAESVTFGLQQELHQMEVTHGIPSNAPAGPGPIEHDTNAQPVEDPGANIGRP